MQGGSTRGGSTGGGTSIASSSRRVSLATSNTSGRSKSSSTVRTIDFIREQREARELLLRWARSHRVCVSQAYTLHRLLLIMLYV
jgi:hypothetical protein